jgi:hypothetical protein
MIRLEEWDWTFYWGFACLLSYGSRPSINGIGTGFYHLRRQVKWRLSFPVHRICREAAHRVLIGCGTFYVMRRHPHLFHFVL